MRNGLEPAIFWTQAADIMSSIIRLKEEFPSLHIIIIGGAEAHLVVDELKESNTDIILSPPFCKQNTFETFRCVDDRAYILEQSGVRFGFGIDDSQMETVALRWEAGIHKSYISESSAIAAITSNIAEYTQQSILIHSIFNLRGAGKIERNEKANFVLYSGDPLSVEGMVDMIVVGDKLKCEPRHF